MKSLKIVSCLLIFLGLHGCIKEDRNECPLDYNAQITLSYTGDTSDHTMFAKMIDHVILYVFNENSGELITVQKLSKKELNNFQGANFQLDPGVYKVVCWANADNDVHITADNFKTATLSSLAFSIGQKLVTESHLYFGIHDVTVQALHELARVDIPFRAAHINLDIFVKGLGKNVSVELSNLASQYDFSMKPSSPFTNTYHPELEFDSQKGAIAAKLQTLRFPADNAIEVKIFDENKQLMETVNLKKYLTENNIHVERTNETTISMLIEFSDLGVSVTVPDWESNPVEPEI